jgi:hypothetical protein
LDSVKKIVNCTPEQFEALQRFGEVEVNGELKTKEEGTLYNPGELLLLEWYNKVMAEQLDQFKRTHTPVIVDSLEREYAKIVTEYPDYLFSSAVGYRAFLKKDDLIGVTSVYNNGEVFINGKRVTKNYSYNGDGVELVSVWVFESGVYDKSVPAKQPILGATPSYYPFEISIKNYGQVPEVAQSYYLYAEKISTYGFDLEVQPRGCRVLIANGINNFTQKVPLTIQEVYSSCDIFTTLSLNNNIYVKKVSLPECKELGSSTSGIFTKCTNITNWEFGKLTKIVGGTNSSAVTFSGVNTVLIPNTVKTIEGWICSGNKTIRLECNNATSIKPQWCQTKPTNFSMAKDWDATVDIATAASGWNKEQFRDLFENYLVDNSNGGDPTVLRTITVPAAIFETLTDEGIIDIALNKGWMIDER